MTDRDQADFDFLTANSRAGQALNLPSFIHLDQPIGLWNYIRIANDIAQVAQPGRLLDWGCGYGQMTYLLQRRGFAVTPFDIGPAEATLPDVPVTRAIPPVVRTLDPIALPFASASFDVVLSCGVLEHVDEHSQPGNERKSLREIARILRPGGLLLIYQLPQKDAWQEAIIRRFKLGYAHPRRYTVPEISQLLIDAGYGVDRVRRANLIPKNLTGMPNRLRRLYSRASRPLIRMDGWLSQTPVLNQAAGVLEIVARRLE
jgi:SAM-dependent methyltransferase